MEENKPLDEISFNPFEVSNPIEQKGQELQPELIQEPAPDLNVEYEINSGVPTEPSNSPEQSADESSNEFTFVERGDRERERVNALVAGYSSIIASLSQRKFEREDFEGLDMSIFEFLDSILLQKQFDDLKKFGKVQIEQGVMAFYPLQMHPIVDFCKGVKIPESAMRVLFGVALGIDIVNEKIARGYVKKKITGKELLLVYTLGCTETGSRSLFHPLEYKKVEDHKKSIMKSLIKDELFCCRDSKNDNVMMTVRYSVISQKVFIYVLKYNEREERIEMTKYYTLTAAMAAMEMKGDFQKIKGMKDVFAQPFVAEMALLEIR